NPDQIDTTNAAVGDACNPSRCYVVDRHQPEQCLAIGESSEVSGGGAFGGRADETLAVGERFVPPLWANRTGETIAYRWTVVSAPAGSSAQLQHPAGAATVSHGWRYLYMEG